MTRTTGDGLSSHSLLKAPRPRDRRVNLTSQAAQFGELLEFNFFFFFACFYFVAILQGGELKLYSYPFLSPEVFALTSQAPAPLFITQQTLAQ